MAFYKWSRGNKELRALVRGCQRLSAEVPRQLPAPRRTERKLSGLKRSLILPCRHFELFLSATSFRRVDAFIFNGDSKVAIKMLPVAVRPFRVAIAAKQEANGARRRLHVSLDDPSLLFPLTIGLVESHYGSTLICFVFCRGGSSLPVTRSQ